MGTRILRCFHNKNIVYHSITSVSLTKCSVCLITVSPVKFNNEFGSMNYVPKKRNPFSRALTIESRQHKPTLVFKVKRNSIHRQSNHFCLSQLVALHRNQKRNLKKKPKKRKNEISTIYRLLLQLQ